MGQMKRILPIVALSLMTVPALAQDQNETDLQEGLDLLSEGTKLLLEGLMDEVGPALQELRNGLEDLNAYHPPEVLPNGDIIIRRKTPREVEDPEDGIEL